jgi:hypothetical protein
MEQHKQSGTGNTSPESSAGGAGSTTSQTGTTPLNQGTHAFGAVSPLNLSVTTNKLSW